MKKPLAITLVAMAVMAIFVTSLVAASTVNVNTASQKELEALKGVGPATAIKIMAARPYASIDQLSKAGLSPKQIDALRPMVSVSGAAAPSPASTIAPAAAARKPAPTAAASRPAPAAAGPVDLNSASEKDLEALKGVGPVTAKKIIAARPYASVEELAKAGFSAKQIDALRPMVSVSRSAAAASAPAVTARKPTPTTSKPAPAAAGPVDLNTASEKELEALKGVGPVTAKRIIAARPYRSVDELSRAGVSARVISELRPSVSVRAPAVAARPPSAAAPAPTPVPMTPAATPARAVPPPAPAPARASAPASTATPRLAPGQTVNINTASFEMLEALPDIGPVKAQAIIDGRPYATIEDIMKVKGIKEGVFAEIKDLITVN